LKKKKIGKAINPEELYKSTKRSFYSPSPLGLKDVFCCPTGELSESFTKSSFVQSLPTSLLSQRLRRAEPLG